MVAPTEVRPRTGLTSPVGEHVQEPLWKLRQGRRDELRSDYLSVPSPGFNPDTMLFYTSAITYSAKVDRSVIAQAGVTWPLIDALWNGWYPDGNIPESDFVRNLTIERTLFSLSIGNPDAGVNIILHLNTQNTLFLPEIRYKDLEAPELVNRAKYFLGQSTEIYKNDYGQECVSYQRTYDIYSSDSIKRDYEISQSLINFIRALNNRGDLVYVHNSDDDFLARYPSYPVSF